MAIIKVISLCTTNNTSNVSNVQNRIFGRNMSLPRDVYDRAIATGNLFNAVKDIECVITENVANVYSDNTPFIDAYVKKNLYDLLKQAYIDKSEFNTFFIPQIASIYDNIEYPKSTFNNTDNPSFDSEYDDGNNTDFITPSPMYLRPHDNAVIEATKLYKNDPYNSYKSDTNIDYVDNTLMPEVMRNVYKTIFGKELESSSANDIRVVDTNRSLSSRLDQLLNIESTINTFAERNNYIKDTLYDRDYIKGVGNHRYCKLLESDVVKKSIDNGFTTLFITDVMSKVYIIKAKAAKPKVCIRIRGIDVHYIVDEISNNTYICKIPQHLLCDSDDKFDMILSAKYVKITLSSNDAIAVDVNKIKQYSNIKYMEYKILTNISNKTNGSNEISQDKIHTNNVNTINLLKI